MCIRDRVQGGYVPYGCYTSAPIPMPLFDALRVSWNAASPEDTAVEAQVRVMVDGNWTPWNSFGTVSYTHLKRVQVHHGRVSSGLHGLRRVRHRLPDCCYRNEAAGEPGRPCLLYTSRCV